MKKMIFLILSISTFYSCSKDELILNGEISTKTTLASKVNLNVQRTILGGYRDFDEQKVDCCQDGGNCIGPITINPPCEIYVQAVKGGNDAIKCLINSQQFYTDFPFVDRNDLVIQNLLNNKVFGKVLEFEDRTMIMLSINQNFSTIDLGIRFSK